MSKRVIVDEPGKKKTDSGEDKKKNKKKKKKRSCCCSCLMGCSITLVIILAIGTGVGWYFGNQFTTQYLDMSLTQCFSVVGGLYYPSEKKIVTNGYEESDLDDFYGSLKKAVFLKGETNISVRTIYELMDSEENSSLLTRALNEERDGEEIGEGETTESGGGSNDAIMNYVSGLFVKDNIDFDRLSAYKRENHKQYLLSATDKSLAAFVNELLLMMLSPDSEMGGSLAEYGINDITEYVSLRQIVLSEQNRDVKTVDEETGIESIENKQVDMLSLTLHIKLVDLLKPVLGTYIENSFLSGAAHFAVKMLLPDHLYITVGMGLNEDVGVDIRVNNLDDEKKVSQAFKLIDGIMSLTGNNEKLENTINKTVSDAVRPFLDRSEQFIDYSDMAEGKLTVDPFAMVINLAHLNDSAETPEDEITSSDLLYTLSSIIGGDYTDGIQPEHAYDNQYVSSDTAAAGYSQVYGTVYDPARMSATNLVDYRDEFLKEMSEKYLIDLDPDGIEDSGDEVEFNDLMALFGIGKSDKQLELMRLIDGKKMENLLNEDAEEIKVHINDRMLGAIIASTLSSVLDESSFGEYDLRLEQIIISKRNVAKTGEEEDIRNFIELGVSIDISSMFGDLSGNAAGSIATAFLPTRVMLSVEMDVTRGVEDERLSDTHIRYNGLSGEETEDVLRVIGKLVGALSIDSITDQLEGPIRSMLDQMYETIGSVELAESKMILPDVFTGISDMLFTTTDNETGDKTAVVSGEEIREMLKGMVGTDDDDYVTATLGAVGASANYDNFTNDIEDKYYIRSKGGVTTFNDIFDIVSISSFDSSKFDTESLKRDNRDASELTPMISDGELARIFEEAMTDNPQLNTMLKIAGIHVGIDGGGRQYIKLVIEMNLSESLGSDISSILPCDVVYVVAVSYVDEAMTDGEGNNYYDTEIGVNEMSRAQLDTLQRMLDHLQGASAMNFDEQAVEIGKIIYSQLLTMSDSLGENGYTFVEGGIKLIDFYTFLARATELDNSDGKYGETAEELAENMKAAIQGLYEVGDGENSKYNYSSENIIMNEIADMSSAPLTSWFEGSVSMTDPTRVNGTMTDKKFGAFIAHEFSANGGRLAELTIISSETYANNRAKIQSHIDELSAHEVAYDSSKEYLRMVIEMSFADLMRGGNTFIETFLPTDGKLYATVYIEIVPGSDNDMREAAVIINSMSETQKNILLALAGIDESKIDDSTKEGLEAVKEYDSAEYKDSTNNDGSIGKLTTYFDLTSRV